MRAVLSPSPHWREGLRVREHPVILKLPQMVVFVDPVHQVIAQHLVRAFGRLAAGQRLINRQAMIAQ